MKIHLLILGLLTFVNCSTKSDNTTIVQTDSLAKDIDIKQTEINKLDSVLYKRELLHQFSSTLEKDTFKIVVTGESLKDGQFKFQIIKKNGQLILDESYETTLLLDYGLKVNPTEKEMEQHIKTRIDNFFNEDNFHSPAISKTDTFDENYGEREIWDDISSDQTAIGFHYLIGEEDGRQIAFSKKSGKVVLYYHCC